jgi:hypothetical protein
MFARNRYIAFGVLGCMATLIVEAALVAEFVPSNNDAALQAAVAMFFVFQVFYGPCLEGQFLSQPLAPQHDKLTHIHLFRYSIYLPRRDFPQPYPSQGRFSRCGDDFVDEPHLSPGCSHRLQVRIP